MKSQLRATACGLLILAFVQPLRAHDARPLSIFIAEQQKNAYRVDVRVPPSIEADNRPEIVFPEDCSVRSGAVRQITDAFAKTMFVTCPTLNTGLEGQRIRIQYALFNPSLSTLLRYSPADGDTRTAVLSPEQSEWLLPEAPSWKSVVRDYFVLGIEHIWAGVDHLLFVTGLLLLAKKPRRIAVAVTGFTLAHSITLSLSALGVLRLPLPPIEAGIALSILFLAREVTRTESQSLAHRYPLAVSSFFGLLHGFGFAAALRESGLPQKEIPTALLFFNAGVEVGQLVFIATVLAAMAVIARVARRLGAIQPLTRVQRFAAYALGIPAAFWFLQRLQPFWLR
jgi:hydrogenase/urease accessory protein HupE